MSNENIKNLAVTIKSYIANLIPENRPKNKFDAFLDLSSGNGNASMVIDEFNSFHTENPQSEEGDIIEFATDAKLKETDSLFELSYIESEDIGLGGVKSILRFKKSNPKTVNLIRRGSAPASLIFNPDVPRRNCSYSLGGFNFDFCICTHNVENTLSSEGGRLILDYDIEIHGIKTEHNVYTLEAKRIK